VVNLYVGITDYDWFRFLSDLPFVDEINFWQPGGRTNFQALRPGELFLFKLHARATSSSVVASSLAPTSCRLPLLGKHSV
jgi:putative restriction endonuclease